jgi:peptide-methionine (R)-S-oxide reductase
MADFDLAPPTDAQRARIIGGLTEEQRHVLLEHGTEAAGSTGSIPVPPTI